MFVVSDGRGEGRRGVSEEGGGDEGDVQTMACSFIRGQLDVKSVKWLECEPNCRRLSAQRSSRRLQRLACVVSLPGHGSDRGAFGAGDAMYNSNVA